MDHVTNLCNKMLAYYAPSYMQQINMHHTRFSIYMGKVVILALHSLSYLQNYFAVFERRRGVCCDTQKSLSALTLFRLLYLHNENRSFGQRVDKE